MNIYEYVTKFGEFTFDEKEFNDIDNLVLSVIMYLDFTNIVSNKKDTITLRKAALEYLHTHDKKMVYKIGMAQKDAYNLIEILMESRRYKDILLSNYRYITSLDSQFSALVFDLNKKIKYIGFEGTDEYISGWKEDAYLAIKFPVDAQKYAIKYLNEVVSLFDKKIIIGGHSKGGNLALVAGMYARGYIKRKIKLIYSNDGPGLRELEYNSRNYKSIQSKYVHIIPNYSLVGVILKNDISQVVEASKKNILAHEPSTWLIEDDHFKITTQSEISKKLEKNVNEFLNITTDEEIEGVIKAIFVSLERAGIVYVKDVINFRAFLDIVKSIKNIDKSTKKRIINILEIIIKEFI